MKQPHGLSSPEPPLVVCALGSSPPPCTLENLPYPSLVPARSPSSSRCQLGDWYHLLALTPGAPAEETRTGRQGHFCPEWTWKTRVCAGHGARGRGPWALRGARPTSERVLRGPGGQLPDGVCAESRRGHTSGPQNDEKSCRCSIAGWNPTPNTAVSQNQTSSLKGSRFL